MGSDKTDQYRLDGEFYDDYQPIVITFYIKDIVLVSYTIHAIKGFLHVCKARPFCPLCFLIPFFQCHFCRSMLCIVFYNFASCYDSHDFCFFYAANLSQFF